MGFIEPYFWSMLQIVLSTPLLKQIVSYIVQNPGFLIISLLLDKFEMMRLTEHIISEFDYIHNNYLFCIGQIFFCLKKKIIMT